MISLFNQILMQRNNERKTTRTLAKRMKWNGEVYLPSWPTMPGCLDSRWPRIRTIMASASASRKLTTSQAASFRCPSFVADCCGVHGDMQNKSFAVENVPLEEGKLLDVSRALQRGRCRRLAWYFSMSMRDIEAESSLLWAQIMIK
jgi:hypothetical protein